MAVNGSIFQNPTTKIPENDSRIVRVPFDKSDLGARKSHLPSAGEVKNDLSVRHVAASGK